MAPGDELARLASTLCKHSNSSSTQSELVDTTTVEAEKNEKKNALGGPVLGSLCSLVGGRKLLSGGDDERRPVQ